MCRYPEYVLPAAIIGRRLKEVFHASNIVREQLVIFLLRSGTAPSGRRHRGRRISFIALASLLAASAWQPAQGAEVVVTITGTVGANLDVDEHTGKITDLKGQNFKLV